jgi:hypothetical protein
VSVDPPAVEQADSTAPAHHASHAALLRRVDLIERRPSRQLDAIIVPTARPPAALADAVELAAAAKCVLVVLCSRNADAATARAMAEAGGVRVVAADIGPGTWHPPQSCTSVASGRLAYGSDTSVKRNVGLALSRMTGWSRVLLLDDDISDVNIAQLEMAAALLDDYRAVGLCNVGYEDNSVVCHAIRDTGGKQDTFIGAGALLIASDRTESFFPEIYNEDWFFLLDGDTLSEVAVAGDCVQRKFDPYATTERARQEEFGDCVAEGLFALLDRGDRISMADAEYWEQFLRQRRRLISGVMDRVPSNQPMAASLRESLRTLQQVKPALCVRYVDNWRDDLDRWRKELEKLEPVDEPGTALAMLGCPPS